MNNFFDRLFDDFPTNVFVLAYNFDQFFASIPRSALDLSSIIKSSRFGIAFMLDYEYDYESYTSTYTYATNENLVNAVTEIADEFIIMQNETSEELGNIFEEARTFIKEFNGKEGFAQFEKVWVNLDEPLYKPCSLTCEETDRWLECNPNASTYYELKFEQQCSYCPYDKRSCFVDDPFVTKACETECAWNTTGNTNEGWWS